MKEIIPVQPYFYLLLKGRVQKLKLSFAKPGGNSKNQIFA